MANSDTSLSVRLDDETERLIAVAGQAHWNHAGWNSLVAEENLRKRIMTLIEEAQKRGRGSRRGAGSSHDSDSGGFRMTDSQLNSPSSSESVSPERLDAFTESLIQDMLSQHADMLANAIGCDTRPGARRRLGEAKTALRREIRRLIAEAKDEGHENAIRGSND